MKNIIKVLIYCLPLLVMGQNSGIDLNKMSNEDQVKILNWYFSTSEMGIEKTKDSIKLGKEFIKVLNDEAYRKTLFPETYTYEKVIDFIKQMQLKPAFWYLINLYPQNDKNKITLIKIILAYDKVFKMDEMLVNVFYTYSFMDPEISVIKEGGPEIIRPDILEKKLSYVKEMVSYVRYYRKQNQVAEAGKN